MSIQHYLPFIAIAVLLSGCTPQPTQKQTPPDDATNGPWMNQAQNSNLPTAKCVGVVDGDTVDILTDDKKQIRLRLAAIDTPERDQPFGNTAKKYLSGLIFGKGIQYEVTETDKYGRSVAFIFIDSKDVNAAMVEAGLAWHYLKYSDDENLSRLESVARTEKRGLWADARHLAPWDWRKLSKEERDKLR